MDSRDQRRHDFDAMRAIMMLLGIVFHACVSFTISDTAELWPYEFSKTNLVFDAVIGTLHAFRIPAFFMISGFFLTRQLTRHSEKAVMKKRFRRVFLPFVICFLFIAPIVTYGFFLLQSKLEFFTAISFKYYLHYFEWNTVHFWFLYYLIIFHVAQLGIRQIPSISRYYNTKNLKVSYVTMILFQLFVLLVFGNESVHGDYTLLPGINTLLYFFSFYIFGNQIYRHLSTFDRWIQFRKPLVIAAIIVNTSYLLLRHQTFIAGKVGVINIVESFVTVVNVNLLILATFSVFYHAFRKESPLVKLLSKSSYFIYIIHLPILIWLLWLFDGHIQNPFVFVLLLILLTTIISFSLYKLQQKYWKKLL